MNVRESDWYRSGTYPQWRDAPPWVMEDMIAAQPSSAESMPGACGAACDVLAPELRSAVERGRTVVVIGQGTAGHAARAAAMILEPVLEPVLGEREPGRGRVVARTAAEELARPLADGLCLAVSHGGATATTFAALARARAAGLPTALITASADESARGAADVVLTTPIVDGSYCHTVGYTSPILAALVLAAALGGEPYPATGIADFLRAMLDLRPRAADLAARLSAARRFVAAGSLGDGPTARELALKIAEGARIPALALDVEDALHGFLAAHDAGSALVLTVTGDGAAPGVARSATGLIRACRRIGMPTTVIATSGARAALDPDLVGEPDLVLPDAPLPPLTVSLLGGAVAAQLLTVGLVRALGVNPDLIRREETAYRESAALGKL